MFSLTGGGTIITIIYAIRISFIVTTIVKRLQTKKQLSPQNR